MQDPCNPPQHHLRKVIHHHPPGQVIGRIRRHGTHRIAQRLHAMAGGCPAGPPVIVGAATLKGVAPSVAFVALTAATSSLIAPADPDNALGGGSVPGLGGPGALGAPPHKHAQHAHHPVSVPEPPSLGLLLLVTLGWMGLRVGLRRRRSLPV